VAQKALTPPPAFQEALRSIKRAKTRGDVALVESPAPGRIAPFAVAVNGEIETADAEATGRFVLLFDPAGQDVWEGQFRVVALVKAVVDVEVGMDDMWADVAWSWLSDALHELDYSNLGCTVTRVMSRSFGSLADAPPTVNVELRASWTPRSPDAGAHIAAWTELLALCAGVPPVPEGVTILRSSSA